MSPKIWLSTFYFQYFFSTGVYLPFCAIWLAWLEMPADDIGMILGAGVFTRFVANLTITPQFHLPNRYVFGLRVLTLTSVLMAGLHFTAFPSFIWLLLLAVLINAAMGPTVPIADAMTSFYHQRQQADYGRVRLWGSISFVLGSSCAGVLLEHYTAAIFAWLLIIPLGLSVIWLHFAPKIEPDEIHDTQSERPSLRRLGLQRPVFLFLLITALIQSSHAAYYAFSALYWTESEISDAWVGYLWSIGVIVEVAVFAMSKRYFSHWSVPQLFVFAALGVVVRWVVMGMTTALPALTLVQGLHGVTFGIAHIAAIRFIQQQPATHAVALQALYYALPLGAVMALMTGISGELYQSFGGQIFPMMASLGGIALPFIFLFSKTQILDLKN